MLISHHAVQRWRQRTLDTGPRGDTRVQIMAAYLSARPARQRINARGKCRARWEESTHYRLYNGMIFVIRGGMIVTMFPQNDKFERVRL